MKLTIQTQSLGGTVLSAEFEEAENSQGLMILSHNASGDMDNKIVVALSRECLRRNISSLRFNFHYVGGIGSEKAEIYDIWHDMEAVFAKAQELSDGPIYVSGKSLGSMAALYLASKHPNIKTLGLFAIPNGMMKKYFDLESLSDIHCPVYIFHGNDDEGGNAEEIEKFLGKYLDDNLHVRAMDGRGHGFEEQNSDEENQKLAEEMVELLLQ